MLVGGSSVSSILGLVYSMRGKLYTVAPRSFLEVGQTFNSRMGVPIGSVVQSPGARTLHGVRSIADAFVPVEVNEDIAIEGFRPIDIADAVGQLGKPIEGPFESHQGMLSAINSVMLLESGNHGVVPYAGALEFSSNYNEPLAKPGDAGSLISTLDGRALGVLLAHSYDTYYGAPIGELFDHLGAEPASDSEISRHNEVAQDAARKRSASTTRFSASMLDILDQVHYRRVSLDEPSDPVYGLRYEAYRREDFTSDNSQKMFRDAYDDADNCYTFGVYFGEDLVSTIRVHHVTPKQRTSPSRSIWPSILDPILDAGHSFIEQSRFVADRDAALAIPALPYLTARITAIAAEYFQARFCVAALRPEHAAFYRRIFGMEELGDGPILNDSLPFPIVLFATDVRQLREHVYDRFQFLLSTSEEREQLFGSSAKEGRSVSASAKQARRLDSRIGFAQSGE